MNRSYLHIFGIAASLFFIYLSLAYPYIYWRIGHGNLPDTKPAAMYQFNENAPGKSLVYVALGDSLTYGVGASDFTKSYPYLLARDLAGADKPIQLITLARPGYTISDLQNNYLPAIMQAKPDVITIMIGVNDLHGRSNLRDFRANYQELIDSIQAETNARIYLISLPFIGNSYLMLPPYQKLFVERTNAFNKVVKELAAENQLGFIDITSPTSELFKNTGPHYSADDFHPSERGYQIIEKIIYDHLRF